MSESSFKPGKDRVFNLAVMKPQMMKLLEEFRKMTPAQRESVTAEKMLENIYMLSFQMRETIINGKISPQNIGANISMGVNALAALKGNQQGHAPIQAAKMNIQINFPEFLKTGLPKADLINVTPESVSSARETPALDTSIAAESGLAGREAASPPSK